MEELKMNGKRKQTMSGQRIFCLVCMVLMAAASIVLAIMLLTSGLLGKGIVWAIVGGLVLLNGLHGWLQLGKGKTGTGRTVCGVIALILTAAMVVGIVAVGKVTGAFHHISKERKEGIYVGVYVLADDPAKELKDVSGYLLGIASQPDRENTLRALKDMEDAVGVVEEKELATSVDLASALLSGDVKAMLLNEAYLDTLEEADGLSDISQKVKLVHEFYYAEEAGKLEPVDTDVLTDSYIIYLSGSDARSTDVSVRARSDTNILAVVNPTTHRILLVNTPRDYYVPLARNGQMDKLTHAGIYGIEESIATLENLYGVNVSYFARINFYGLKDIVDAVGGIDVVSPKTFTLSTNACSKSGNVDREVVEGINHMDGAKALAFARERYGFADGDNQRGKNQMAILQALTAKLTKASSLVNYQSILSAVSNNMTTNLAYDDITALVRTQLTNMSEWQIDTYAVTQGSGSTSQPCYSLGGAEAWVMPQNTESVQTARSMIQEVLSGTADSQS